MNFDSAEFVVIGGGAVGCGAVVGSVGCTPTGSVTTAALAW